MKNACEGVLYPQDAGSKIELKFQESQRKQPKTLTLRNTDLTAFEVPHKAWLYCKKELENTFSYLKHVKQEADKTASTIFVLAPLHKGPIDFDDKIKIYCPEDGNLKGSDWQIKLETPQEIKALPFLEQNDDVCTEEHSLEVIAPFISSAFPEAKVCYLLAPAQATPAQATPAQATSEQALEEPAQNLEEICKITSIIGRLHSDSLIFISNNNQTNCASIWIG
jgi:AmmeMemoRadiSam system protein B